MALKAPPRPTKKNQLQVARRAAAKENVPPSLLAALLHQESGFSEDVALGTRRSTAGAIGPGQLMPGTAKGLGVDPYNWQQNIHGAARYLSQQLRNFNNDPRLALSAYNSGPGGSESSGQVEGFSETQAYVKNVMALEKQYKGMGGTPEPLAELSGAVQETNPQASVIFETLGAKITPGKPYLESLQRLGPLSQRVFGEAEQFTPITRQRIVADDERTAPEVAGVPPSLGQAPIGKWVSLAAGADREGMRTSKKLLKFAARVGKVRGTPVVITTGTNHSKMTTSGNVSQHWTGHGGDIPASGDELTELGYSALVAAGMPPKLARKNAKKGGLFNIGGRQIIFKTDIGGNHWDHLHIGD